MAGYPLLNFQIRLDEPCSLSSTDGVVVGLGGRGGGAWTGLDRQDARSFLPRPCAAALPDGSMDGGGLRAINHRAPI